MIGYNLGPEIHVGLFVRFFDLYIRQDEKSVLAEPPKYFYRFFVVFSGSKTQELSWTGMVGLPSLFSATLYSTRFRFLIDTL